MEVLTHFGEESTYAMERRVVFWGTHVLSIRD